MPKSRTRVAKTATEALRILWEDGFFRTWKKSPAVVERLAKRGNNFSGPELGMALKRARHLTRRGKAGSFEYIQKYPFVPEPARVQEK
ncbi:MAG: hypothetical protein L0Z53_23480 [Acidobacteriales bacterium]|nr:hypothetical protein [Terriglobales bacterium]